MINLFTTIFALIGAIFTVWLIGATVLAEYYKEHENKFWEEYINLLLDEHLEPEFERINMNLYQRTCVRKKIFEGLKKEELI